MNKKRIRYLRNYRLKNAERIKMNFKKWYSDPKNKEKHKIYMRKYMRQRNNIPEDKFRVKNDE